jgi:hypothetical protein
MAKYPEAKKQYEKRMNKWREDVEKARAEGKK